MVKNSEFAFTLLELLVVILVLATLIAIALPNFLGQSDKAQDSQAQLTLSNSVKTLQLINTEQPLPTPESELVTLFQQDEPAYSYHAYNSGANPSTGATDVSLEREGPNQASMCVRSNSKQATVFCARVNRLGTLVIASVDDSNPLDSFGSLVTSINPLFPESATAASEEMVSSSRVSRCSGDTEAEARGCLATSSSTGEENEPDPDPEPETCPEGMIGTPPDCLPEECPEGEWGIPPNCHPVLVYSEEIAADGPSAQCPFDESGTAYVNLSCTNIGGQYQDNSSKFLLQQPGAILSAPSGRSAYFTGETHYSYGNPSSASTNNQGQNWSVEIWARPADSGTSQNIVSADDNWGLATAGGNGFRLYHRAGNPWSVISIQGGAASEAGRWYHLVGTYNSGVLKLYVNGVEVASQPGVPIGQSGNGNFRPGYASGGWVGGGYFKGNLDQFTFYKKTLSPQRIQTHYQAAQEQN